MLVNVFYLGFKFGVNKSKFKTEMYVLIYVLYNICNTRPVSYYPIVGLIPRPFFLLACVYDYHNAQTTSRYYREL